MASKITGPAPMKPLLPLVMLLALSAAPGAWSQETPAQAPVSTGPANPASADELPYGTGYEARQRQAAERQRSQKAAETQRPERPPHDVPGRGQDVRPARPMPRATERPSDTRPVRPERTR
jgi:hypothetical protein